MKRLRTYFILLLAVISVGMSTLPQEAQAQGHHGSVVSVNTFFEPLAAHGDWHYTQEYGWVWSPYRVAAHWQPYTQGHWVWTDDYGWMWVSDEAFGWATYHYGRWVRMGGAWVWVPGTTWGPAWVAWSHTNNYVGWAPLPPSATVSSYSGTVNINVNIGWNSWVYVPGANILSVNLNPYYMPANQVQVIWQRARPASRYRVHRGAVTLLGPNTVHFTRWLGYRPPAVTISYTNQAVNTWYRNQTVYVYRTPPPPRSAYRRTPPPPRRAVPPALRTSVVKPPPPSGRYNQPASSKVYKAPPPKQGRSNTYKAPPPKSYNSGSRQAPPPPQGQRSNKSYKRTRTPPPPSGR